MNAISHTAFIFFCARLWRCASVHVHMYTNEGKRKVEYWKKKEKVT